MPKPPRSQQRLERELAGDEAVLRGEADHLVIERVGPASLRTLLATLEPLADDVGPIAGTPPDPVDL